MGMFLSNKTSSARPNPNRRRSEYYKMRYHPNAVCAWPNCTKRRSQTKLCVKHFGMDIELEMGAVEDDLRQYIAPRKSKAQLSAKKRADAIARQQPSWANKKKIERIYHLARWASKFTDERLEVDHIIPLQGRIVSGLHIESNLQIITKTQNRIKSNKFANRFLAAQQGSE